MCPFIPHHLNFNPRSREGSDTSYPAFLRLPLDFNPRSREGSDRHSVTIIRDYMLISIHAPVKGATLSIAAPNLPPSISIHAPVKGATL